MTVTDDQTAERELTIINRLGLHARAAARFVSVASQFDSEVLVHRDEQTVNGKSIMGIMMLAAAQGTTLLVTARGSDCQQALDALETLVNQRFDEAE